MSHFLKNVIYNSSVGATAKELPSEAFIALQFLEELVKFDGSSREIVRQTLGTYIFDYYKK